MIRALVIARDSSHQGGVVSFVELLVANFSPDVQASRFVIGRSPGKQSRSGALAKTAYDGIRLIRWARKHRPDVIHINPSLNLSAMLRDGALMTALATIDAPPVVMFVHGWDDGFLAKTRRSGIARYLVGKLLNRADRIVVLANRFKEELCSLGVDDRKVYVTTTMFDRRLFQGVQRSIERRGPKLLFLSRLVKEKGIHELLAAFLILKAKLPNVSLTVAGDGPEYPEVQRWINEHRVSDQIVLAGYLRGEAKAQVLVDADVFVFPSYYGDGCPVSLLEAMAAGLGVVTTAVGGIPDFFVDGQNGSLLSSVSPASF
jgi:glycosyltransferase involved in cell wall biosynthesis